MEAEMKILFQLFLSFARIGGLTFGGGLAMLPMLKHELCEKKQWVTEDEIVNYYAIGQCTPGIIAVNTATFVGFKKKGIIGGIVATLGMVFPSVVIIILAATVLNHFMGNEILQHALGGIRAAACALIVNTVITLSKKSLCDIVCIAMFVLALVASLVFSVPSVIIVAFSGIVGVISGRIRREKAK